jgi:cell division protein FtsB
MTKRVVCLLLLVLLAGIQAQLWFGRGSLPNVRDMQHRLAEQQAKNIKAQVVNDQLSEEVRDLREGLDIVEEKARSELGMVKPNEIFVQVKP